MQFVIKRIKGIIIAISGMFFLLKNEDSIKVQSLFFLLFIFLGYYFEITKNEWIIHIILIGFILLLKL
jgi:Prokaryotic diacylglycerol kinase.